MYFQYGQEETEYLSGKDEKLGAVIAQVGRVNREVDTDLFSAVVHHIVGQQISTKAQATIWQRMRGALGTVDAEHILEAGNEQLQLLGISCRKAEYITDFARKIQNGEFDLEGIWQKPDEEVIRELSALKGIGVWTAEMILLFCMQRPDVFSYDDLAIQRGLRMVYHHRKIDRNMCEEEKLVKDMMRGSNLDSARSIKMKENSILFRIQEAEERRLRLYEDYKAEILDEDEYSQLKEHYIAEKQRLEHELQKQRQRALELEKRIKICDAQMERMRGILNQNEFDEELVHELIKKIYVGMDNSVEVEFKCSDPYQEVLAIMSEVQNE